MSKNNLKTIFKPLINKVIKLLVMDYERYVDLNWEKFKTLNKIHKHKIDDLENAYSNLKINKSTKNMKLKQMFLKIDELFNNLKQDSNITSYRLNIINLSLLINELEFIINNQTLNKRKG